MNTRRVNTHFNSASVRKTSSIEWQIKNAVNNKKGLKVSKNMFSNGWSIELPNGSYHNSPNDADMVNFVKGY
jgi:hypothetical protein